MQLYIILMMRSRLLAASATGKINGEMKKQRSGVILNLTLTPGGISYRYTGGFAPACSAIESFSTNLAAELRVYCVRVINMSQQALRTQVYLSKRLTITRKKCSLSSKKMEEDTVLKKLPLMENIANLPYSSHLIWLKNYRCYR